MNRLQAKAIALSLGVFSTCAFAEEVTFSGQAALKRADFAGNEGLEIISAFYEFKPAEDIPQHIHHGVESCNVIQGAVIQAVGKDPIKLETGTSWIYNRDVPHGGIKTVGDTSLKIFCVNVVDKGKPFAETPSK